MKALLLVLAVAISQSVFAADKGLTKKESPKVIEAKIRKQLKKPTGELTKSDYEKETELYLFNNQLTDLKGLGKTVNSYLGKRRLTHGSNHPNP